MSVAHAERICLHAWLLQKTLSFPSLAQFPAQSKYPANGGSCHYSPSYTIL